MNNHSQQSGEPTAQYVGKREAFPFYTGDWLKDLALRSVSLAARGLWIDLLALMFHCPRPGLLQQANGSPMSAIQIARMTGCSPDEAVAVLAELDAAGVFSRTADGVIYSRRMVRDGHKRQLCSEAGKRGGNPILKGRRKGRPNPPVDGPSTSQAAATVGESGSATSAEQGVAKITLPEARELLTLKGRTNGRHNQNLNPSSSSSTSVLRPPTSQKEETTDRFAEFWAAYPRRVKRVRAEAAWAKLCPDDKTATRIVADVRRRAVSKDWAKEGGRFIPHPSTYLNDRRWEDEDMTLPEDVVPNGTNKATPPPILPAEATTENFKALVDAVRDRKPPVDTPAEGGGE
jgi:hypothetical protein